MTDRDHTDYQRFDQDMRRIEAFNDKVNDPDQPLGALLQEYLEQVRPTSRRVQAQLRRWRAEIEADPTPAPPPGSPDDAPTDEAGDAPPPDDVPF